MKIVAKKSISVDGLSIHVIIIKLFKSHLVLISDKEEMGIGSVSLSTPSTIEGLKPSISSFNLFGMGTEAINTFIAERLAHSLKTPVLLLFFLKTALKEKYIKHLMECLKEMTSKINK